MSKVCFESIVKRQSQTLAKALTIAGLAICLLVSITSTSHMQDRAGLKTPGTDDVKQRRVADFKALDIQKRARAIKEKLRSQDIDKVKQAETDRSKLLQDFQAWGEKYNVKLINHVIKGRALGRGGRIGAEPPNPSVEAKCETQILTDKLICILKSAQVNDRGQLSCSYVCTPQQQTVLVPYQDLQ